MLKFIKKLHRKLCRHDFVYIESYRSNRKGGSKKWKDVYCCKKCGKRLTTLSR